MKRSLIVAMSSNRVIGRRGGLPWHLPADLRRFRQLTWGHPIIMGRITFESIGRALPGRTSIIVTRQPSFPIRDVLFAGSLESAWELAADSDEAFVIGGAQLYTAALPAVGRLYVTDVQADVEGDTFFPDWDESAWKLIEESHHGIDERHAFACRFRVFERVGVCRSIGRAGLEQTS